MHLRLLRRLSKIARLAQLDDKYYSEWKLNSSVFRLEINYCKYCYQNGN